MDADEYDLAATAVGVVEADAVLGPERVRDGDVVIAMASSGLHSNGYSLVRKVVAAAGLDLTATPAGLDRPLGEELLEPTRIYARDCLALVASSASTPCTPTRTSPAAGWPGTRPASSPRAWRPCWTAATWQLPAAVRLLEEHGVPREEAERAFNCGVGMVAAVAAAGRRRRRGPADRGRHPVLGRRHGRSPDGRRGTGRAPGRHLPLTPLTGPTPVRAAGRDHAPRHRGPRRDAVSVVSDAAGH